MRPLRRIVSILIVMDDSALNYRGAAELTEAMAAGEVSSVELTESAIGRIERFDASINAVCVRDFDRALAAARAADAARARGEVRPLLGVPMTVKESFHVAGLPITWGIPPFRDVVSDTDALAVARVKDAGAVLLGKTNVPFSLGDYQSFNAIYGTTNNPWDPQRTPGGSSGGSAAALAAGYGALSLGTDIGGSLGVPAHYCGVYSHKPTLGLVPGRGHTPPDVPVTPTENDLAVIGPMARTAADLALLLGVLAGPDELADGPAYRLALPEPRHAALADYRVLVIDDHPLIPTSAAVRGVLDEFTGKLVGAGTTVARDSPLLPDLADAAGLYCRLLMARLGARYPREIYEASRAMAAQLAADDRGLAAERARGTVLSHRDWLDADTGRAVLRQRWRALFAQFDVVLCPVTPTPASRHDHGEVWSRRIDIDGTEHAFLDQIVLPGLASLPGLPVTVLPVGIAPGGLPVGVQAVGPMFEDRTTIRFAELAEREFGGFTPPPLG